MMHAPETIRNYRSSADPPHSPGKKKAKNLCRHIGRAINRFRMIEPGDKILIGVSGGKDSPALRFALSERKKWARFAMISWPFISTGGNILSRVNRKVRENIFRSPWNINTHYLPHSLEVTHRPL
jgi:hypothetical protein